MDTDNKEPFKLKVEYVKPTYELSLVCDETRYYELTDDTIELDGHVLHRIRALVDSPRGYFRKGEYGGFIESYKNLNTGGWVADDACVYEDAMVMDGALVCDNARVHGYATVCQAVVEGHAEIYARARVLGSVRVSENAKIYDRAMVLNQACVRGNARVYGEATIGGYARVYGYACVYGNSMVYVFAEVKDYAHVYWRARIYGRAVVYGFARIGGYAVVGENTRVNGFTTIHEDGSGNKFEEIYKYSEEDKWSQILLTAESFHTEEEVREILSFTTPELRDLLVELWGEIPTVKFAGDPLEGLLTAKYDFGHDVKAKVVREAPSQKIISEEISLPVKTDFSSVIFHILLNSKPLTKENK